MTAQPGGGLEFLHAGRGCRFLANRHRLLVQAAEVRSQAQPVFGRGQPLVQPAGPRERIIEPAGIRLLTRPGTLARCLVAPAAVPELVRT